MKYANISNLKGNAFTSKNLIESERVINIGDYVQIFAIENLYNELGIDKKDIVNIEYYDLYDYDGDYVILPINFILFNAYYKKRSLIFSSKIIPVFLAVSCISGDFSKEEIDYFKKFSPIGCRDEYTLNIFKNLGVESYLNGCLSVTLPKRKETNIEHGKTFFVDVSDELMNHVPKELLKNSVNITHQYYGSINNQINGLNIDDFSRNIFDKYKNEANLVITSRLHCAAPCIAMGIPVIFAHGHFNYSFAWIDKLIPVYTKENYENIDWNPTAIDYEKEKKIILDLAKKRILETYEKYNAICTVSQFFENRTKQKYVIAYIENFDNYVFKNNLHNKHIKYGFWGVTQITELLYNHINKNYHNFELVVIFDKYREIEFNGMKSLKPNDFRGYEDVCIIATGNSSCIEAKEIFEKDNRSEDKFCLCFNTKYEKI